MKKLFATIACTALFTFGVASAAFAQDAEPATDAAVETTTTENLQNEIAEPQDEATVELQNEAASATEVPEEGFHQALKRKFIEGGADFMAVIALLLIIGLALCLERIIYLSLCDIDQDGFLSKIEDLLRRNEIEKAKDLARNTRGPVASIAYQALLRLDQGTDVVERSVASYGSVQGGLLEKNLSWITLFIAMAPSLGFLGTVVGMVMAFDNIQKVGDISPTIVAGGMKVALITTIGGLIVALILQLFYNYILNKVEDHLNKMEDASVSLMDMVIKYNIKKEGK